MFEKIYKSSLKFLEPSTLEKVCSTIVHEAVKLIKAEYGSIFLARNGGLERVYASSPAIYEINIQPNGFIYKSIKKHKAYVLNVSKDNSPNPIIKKLKIKSIIVIPLSYKNESIGVLTVLSLKEETLTHKELNALKLFGSMATLAIKKADLLSEKKEAIRDVNYLEDIENKLEKIYKAALRFLERLTPEETYRIVSREAEKLVDGQYSSLVLENEGVLKQIHTTLPIEIKRRKKGTTYKVFKNSRLGVIYPEESQSFRRAHPEFLQLGIKTIIDIPLAYKSKTIGVLSIDLTRKHHFGKKEQHYLFLFGSLVTLGIRKTQLYNEAKKALETRDLFISLAAHELRTPLTTVSGYIELIQRKISQTGSIESKWIDQASKETKRLSFLINELLEINRIKTGQFQYYWKECNLKDIIKRAVDNFTFTYPKRKLIFEDNITQEADVVIGDFDKLLQVMSNLLENAAKFSSQDKEIKLSLGRKGSYCILQVIDQGKGIPRRDLPNIFEGFYKGKDHDEKGMGLGLFLVKTILEQHRGSIKIFSELNKGTRAEIRLPKAKI